MKKLAIILFVLPLFIQAQNDYENATFITNTLRSFDVAQPVYNDSILNIEAKAWAEHLALKVSMGYSLYESNSKNYDIAIMKPDYATKNYYSEAVFAFLILPDNPMRFRKKMVNQYAKAIGFGHAYVDDKVIVVFKFREVED